MAHSSSPPHDGVRIMLLIVVMEAIVYTLELLLQSSSPPLLAVEPTSHTPSSSTMALHRMA